MLKSSYLGYQCKIRGFCDQDMFTMISLFRSSSVQSRRVMINILPKPPTAIKSFNSIKLAGNLSKSEIRNNLKLFLVVKKREIAENCIKR